MRARKMAFKIETVKWAWAEKVQSKDVYRDDELIRTASAEMALEAIDFLMKQPRGLTYIITVYREGEYFTYWRHSMPCLGGLVKYRDSHGEKHFMNPYFPRDIRVAFPEGEIKFIACYRENTKGIFKLPYYEFIFSNESPWVSCFGDKETIIFRDKYFVLTNMDTDPTVFYSLMRLAGFAAHNVYASSGNWNPKADILLRTYNSADPRRIAGQKPIKISGGTWAEGYGYTRPYNESIFKEKLPTKFKDFGKLAGYPQAPHTNKYFLGVMKEKFGVEATRLVMDKNLEGILVKAWDYFKEQSKELSDAA